MKITALIPAAGSGSRYSDTKNKLLETINGAPVIVHTLSKIASVERIDDIIVVSSMIEEIEELVRKYNVHKIKQIIPGGKTRQESVYNGLKSCNNPDYVLIHDGARPLVSPETINSSINCAILHGACIAAVPAKDTIKRVDHKTLEIVETLNRDELWNVQTPQVFKYADILDVHEKFAGYNCTDDAALMEKADKKVFVVMGGYKNIKITTQEDINAAELYFK